MREKNPPSWKHLEPAIQNVIFFSSLLRRALAELEIPDNANVFYAVNRSDEAMHFILRRKADQVWIKGTQTTTVRECRGALSMAMTIT